MRARFLALALAIVFASTAAAQSSVWQIASGDNVIYLGGTCHMLRPSDFPLPPEFDEAYAAADAVYFETDMERITSPEVQRAFLEQGTYQDGGTLREEISEEAWQALEDHCDQAGFPIEAFAQMKPWLASITLSVIELQMIGATQEGVDAHFSARAREDNKPQHGLETIEQQLSFLSTMAQGQESEFVLSTLRDLERAPEILEVLVAAWRSGNLDEIDAYFVASMREEFPDMYETLIAGRNRDWMDRIKELLETPQVELVLVGAGHLGGPGGLLTLLREAGFEIHQIQAGQ